MEIDSVAIATTLLNLGELRTSYQYQPRADSKLISLTANCHMVCSKKTVTLKCPKCAEEISLDECFKDKAAENELKTTIIRCTNQDCLWEGPEQFFMVSYSTSIMTSYSIPNILFWAIVLLKLSINHDNHRLLAKEEHGRWEHPHIIIILIKTCINHITVVWFSMYM